MPQVSTKDVKRELSRRVAVVTTPEFLESRIRPCLGADAGASERWETNVVQLDGTGAATVEIKLDGHGGAFAKLYPNESGALIYEKLHALRARGFGAGDRYQAVEPLGFIREYGLLLTRRAEGAAVADAVEAGDARLVAGAREAARWIAKLHGSALRVGPPQSLLESGELLPLARRLAKMISKRPEFLELAVEMVGALEELAEETVEGRLVQSHGQYRPIHVFVTDSTVTVIDLDRSRPSDPARDVAEFLHRLRMTVASRRGSVEPADAATEAFLETYVASVPDPSYLANLRFHWARYIAHSLNRKLKPDDIPEEDVDSTVELYLSEFANVITGRFDP